MKSIIFSIIISTISIKSFSQYWMFIGKGADGGKVYLQSKYVRKGYEKGRDNVIEIWTKETSPKLKIKGKIYKNTLSKILYLIDCQNNQLLTLDIVDYDSEENLISSTKDYYTNEWKNIVPDSVGEMIMENVCKLFN